jgi:hypothetical protein
MVTLELLTKKQKEALEEVAKCRIAGPCSLPSINVNEVVKIVEKIRVEVKKP